MRSAVSMMLAPLSHSELGCVKVTTVPLKCNVALTQLVDYEQF